MTISRISVKDKKLDFFLPKGEDVFEPMVGMEDNSTKIWQLSIKASVNV